MKRIIAPSITNTSSSFCLCFIIKSNQFCFSELLSQYERHLVYDRAKPLPYGQIACLSWHCALTKAQVAYALLLLLGQNACLS